MMSIGGAPRLGSGLLDFAAIRAVLAPTSDTSSTLAGSLARVEATSAPVLVSPVSPAILSAPVGMFSGAPAPVLRHVAAPIAPPADSGMIKPAVVQGVSSPATAAPLSPAQFRPPARVSRGLVDTSPRRQKDARRAAAAAPATKPVADVQVQEASARRGAVPTGVLLAAAAAAALLIFGGR